MERLRDRVDDYCEATIEQRAQHAPEVFDYRTVTGFKAGLVGIVFDSCFFLIMTGMLSMASGRSALPPITSPAQLGLFVGFVIGWKRLYDVQRTDVQDLLDVTNQDIIVQRASQVLFFAIYGILFLNAPAFALLVAVGVICGKGGVLLWYFLPEHVG